MSWPIRSKCNQRKRGCQFIVENRNENGMAGFPTGGVLRCEGICGTNEEATGAAFVVQQCRCMRRAEMQL